MSTVFRSAKRKDQQTLFEILQDAYQLQGHQEKRTRMRQFVAQDPEGFVILEEGAEAVAAAHIARHRLQIGSAYADKGDVGHVAVRSERQAQGYGTQLMVQTVQFMRDAGFHMSRLGGLHRFYSRFGYEPFLRRYIHIPVAPMDAEIKGRPWAEIRALPDHLAAATRPYDPPSDHAAVHHLRRTFNRGRSGCVALPEAPGQMPAPPTEPEPLVMVFETRGRIVGYLRGSLGLVHATDRKPSYRIDDFAVEQDDTDACEALLKTFIWQAARIAPTVISARLPYDERLFAALMRAGIAFELVEMHQATDGNMMQVLNLQSLLHCMAAELSDRLRTAGCTPWAGTLAIRLPRQEGTLGVADDGVRSVTPDEADAVVETDHATVLKWLFGISGFAESADRYPQLPDGLRLLLSVLFPRLPCASGPWG